MLFIHEICNRVMYFLKGLLLAQGIWDNQNVDKSGNDIDEYDFGRQSIRPFQNRRTRGRESPRKMRAEDDDWELPMDY